MTEPLGRKVAIVDDDSAVRDSLSFLLDTMWYPSETFASAAEFLNAQLAQVACLIIDHHMPQMTGLELAEKLRADGSSIRILLITGSPSPEIVSRAAALDVKVLEKPPSEEDLAAFIEASKP
jgi:FixJ family two-component response regulator